MFNNNMRCIVCGDELESPASRDGIKIKIHEDCLTEDLEMAFYGAVSPFLYKKDGKLMKGHIHKEHEEV